MKEYSIDNGVTWLPITEDIEKVLNTRLVEFIESSKAAKTVPSHIKTRTINVLMRFFADKCLRDVTMQDCLQITKRDFLRQRNGGLLSCGFFEKAIEEKALVMGMQFRDKDSDIEKIKKELDRLYHEYEANPFAIDQKTRQRIVKFVTEYISSSFKTAFGKQLMSINNAQRYEFRARHEWIIMRSVTVIGWLLAIAMLIIVLLR